MEAQDLIPLLADSSLRAELKRALDLPTDSVAAALDRLTEAQARTDASVQKLSEAQARTDASVQRLTEAQARTDASVQKLTEAQARTDASLQKLSEAQARTDASLQKLSEAQARTDASLQKLSEAQARTDASVQKLFEAQARTDTAIAELVREGREMRKAIGALADNVGFSLEELAAIVLPGVLEREAGIRIDHFERRFVATPEGEEELDLYGTGERSGSPVVVAGEVKSRIYRGDVERFAAKAKRLAAGLEEPLVGVLFGFVVHPSARDAAAARNIHVVASRPGS